MSTPPVLSMAEFLRGAKSYSSHVLGLQLAWDSTSMGTFKVCPRKYQLAHLEGWRTKQESFHLTFGLLYHAALETYDKAKAQGVPHEEATVAAVRYALERSGERHILAAHSQIDPETGTVEEYPAQEKWTPWESGDNTKSRETFVRTVIWYLDHFKSDPAETVILANGKAAVELSFRFELGIEPTLEGEAFLLCGHMDRLVQFNDQVWVLDRKTTKGALDMRYFAQYSPDNQMSLYSFASRVVLQQPARGVIIDAAQIGVTFSRFSRGFSHRTEAQLDEWLRDFKLWVKLAEQFARASYWPMNDTSCSKYGGCAFQGICSKDPASRLPFLKSNFNQVLWDPLVPRN